MSFWPTWRENKLFTLLLTLIGVGAALLTLSKAVNSFKENRFIGKPEVRDTITVDGEGKIVAVPDIAAVSVGILTEGREVAQVQAQNTAKMKALLDKVKALGVEVKDIQTTQYSISPRYDWVEGKRFLQGYQVEESASVKIRDLTKIGAILSAVGEAGANQVSGVSFTIDEPETLRAQAREKAFDKAAEKAASLAAKAGVKLGKVISFNEYSPGGGPTYYKSMDTLSFGMGGASEAAAPPAPVESGSLDVVVNVNVTYEIL